MLEQITQLQRSVNPQDFCKELVLRESVIKHYTILQILNKELRWSCFYKVVVKVEKRQTS